MDAQQNKQSPLLRILSSSSKMAVATLSSRILGLVREQCMAAYFGAGLITDAFLVAYRIPNMLRDLFAEGAFSSAFVPIFTDIKRQGEDKARSLLWSVFCLLFLITSFLGICFFIFSDELVLLMAPKFVENQEQFILCSNMIKVMSPFLMLISLAALWMGVLNTLKIFFTPALAPAFFNVVMILAIIFLPEILKDKFGTHPALALSLGVLAGGIVQLFFQFPLILKRGFGPKGPIVMFQDSSKLILHRLGIGGVGIAANQINVIVSTIIASGTLVGAVSWLTYAFRLFQFPVGILGVSIAGSNLVHFSENWKADKKSEAIEVFKSSIFLCLFVMIPAMILLMSAADYSMHLIFERGVFTHNDTLQSALALKCYLFGLPFYGMFKILTPTYYAIDKPKVPVMTSIISIVFNIIFCLLLTPVYGFQILAIGTALSMVLNCVIQLVILKGIFNQKLKDIITLRILKLTLCAGMAYGVLDYIKGGLLIYELPMHSKLLNLGLFGFIGILIYATLLLMFGELNYLKNFLKRFIKLSKD
ncbi:MAG: murein biosynthesis integral membrane protein MurJ [Halobacteriovoraceae bacterium]|nr:murein biosynthesis integral membrane protein MurJ [Halobacteriovoraceae bacterium]